MRRTNEKIIDSLKLELLERIAKEIRKKYGIDGTKKVLYLYKNGFITLQVFPFISGLFPVYLTSAFFLIVLIIAVFPSL